MITNEDKSKVIGILNRHSTMTFGDKRYDGIEFSLGDLAKLIEHMDTQITYRDEIIDTYAQEIRRLEDLASQNSAH